MKTTEQVAADPVVVMTNAMLALGFNPHGSEVVAIQRVQELVEDAKDPLAQANKIITTLGCTPVLHAVQARILAKTLVQQYVLRGGLYDAEEAMKVAAHKYIDMERTMPFLFAGSEGGKTPLTQTPTGVDPARVKVAKAKRGGDKKERALEIFNAYLEPGKAAVTDSDIAKDIAKQLDITFANAYYYTTRVFRKKFGANPVKGSKGKGSKK